MSLTVIGAAHLAAGLIKATRGTPIDISLQSTSQIISQATSSRGTAARTAPTVSNQGIRPAEVRAFEELCKSNPLVDGCPKKPANSTLIPSVSPEIVKNANTSQKK